MTVRISEYYDVFDVKVSKASNESSQLPNIEDSDDRLPDDIIGITNEVSGMGINTNPFSGFSNWNDFAANNPSNTTVIAGKHKAPQAVTNIRVDENGDIWCYPPNVSVPYWNKIIFRNYDYNVNCSEQFLARADAVNGDKDSGWSVIKRWAPWIRTQLDTYTVLPTYADAVGNIIPVPKYTRNTSLPDVVSKLWGRDASTLSVPSIYKYDWTNVIGTSALISEGTKVPLFLKYDEYPSRSKVIFSSVDKTRNPDIEHKFGYHKGQMEPIKLNLGFSPNQYIVGTNGDTYNANLREEDIITILSKCYWSIEWVYERESGN